jgi:cystathionine beta-lyase
MPSHSIANFLKRQPQSTLSKQKTAQRKAFLRTCRASTKRIHQPILDLYLSRGHLNPGNLGDVVKFSAQGSQGQCSVGFDILADYMLADETDRVPAYGGGEYGITLTPEADALGRKMTALHRGKGAIVCPSGLSAITTVFNALHPRAVLMPDHVYAPTFRYLRHRGIEIVRYSVRAEAGEIEEKVKAVLARLPAGDLLIYVEAPGSGTFEIPDLDGIVKVAKAHGIRTVMDNTYASHARFKPLARGFDMALQATTKYEGGYGDTPSGVVITNNPADLEILQQEVKVSGNGAISPMTCARLFNRVDTVGQRMDQSFASAQQVMDWFAQQLFVSEIICPARPHSPDYARFKHYFRKGNGLFSIAFRPDIDADTIARFADALLLFRIAASWGGHVSLVAPVGTHRQLTKMPQGHVLRFHAGLEDPRDLISDLEQAAVVFLND